jgi:hypothetical protein
MSSDRNVDAKVPEGAAFLDLVWHQEDDCEVETDKRIPSMGRKAPACLELVGTVLSLLDGMASCWWVCRQGDHVIEYLCGRVVSNGRAAVRLMRFGFYDESLALCRSIGEAANLLCLFQRDKAALEDWKASSRGDRLRNYSPVKVRVRLETLNVSVPINQERYTLLSERAAHVHPATKPQSHNVLGVPTAGASLQDEGLLVCLNELAVALALATTFGALLLDLEKTTRKHILLSAKALAEQIGGATITEIGDYHRQLREDPAASEEIKRIADALRQFQRERHR